MAKLVSISDKYFLKDYGPRTLEKHLHRVFYFKQVRERGGDVDYVDELIKKKIDFKGYLKKQHKKRVKECTELILCGSPDYFYEIYPFFSADKDRRSLESVYLHEARHYARCQRYGVNAYFAIKFADQDISRLSKKTWPWRLHIQGLVVALFEEKALQSNWEPEQYIAVMRDCADIAGVSAGDKAIIKIIRRIERHLG